MGKGQLSKVSYDSQVLWNFEKNIHPRRNEKSKEKAEPKVYFRYLSGELLKLESNTMKLFPLNLIITIIRLFF